jgi:hypothetical protein
MFAAPWLRSISSSLMCAGGCSSSYSQRLIQYRSRRPTLRHRFRFAQAIDRTQSGSEMNRAATSMCRSIDRVWVH